MNKWCFHCVCRVVLTGLVRESFLDLKTEWVRKNNLTFKVSVFFNLFRLLFSSVSSAALVDVEVIWHLLSHSSDMFECDKNSNCKATDRVNFES